MHLTEGIMQTQARPKRPIMPYPTCCHCGAEISLDDVTYRGYEGSITCFQCKGKFYIKIADDLFPKVLCDPRPLGDPELLEGLSAPIIPKSLYETYKEANLALAVGIPKGAAVLCRYLVQWALLENDIPEGPPDRMVNIARQRNLLSEMAYRQAAAAVFIGGKAGHPQHDWLDNVGKDEAKQSLLRTKRILLELYNPSAIKKQAT